MCYNLEILQMHKYYSENYVVLNTMRMHLFTETGSQQYIG